MKKHICLFCAAALLLSLCCGCGQSAAPTGTGKLRAVASAFPEYEFLRAVAGDRAEVTLLLSPGTEPHSYEPSPQDVIAIQGSDLFVYGGGESDVWLDRVLDAGQRERLYIVSLMDHAVLREEEVQDHMTAEEEDEGEGPAYDEHVWTSPANAIRIVEAIRAQLAALDPAGEAVYTANAAAYTEKLTDLDARFRQMAADAARDELVFGDRFPFLYLVREYGLKYAAAFPGCSSGTDANPATVTWLIDRVAAEGIPVIFKCDLSAGRLADTIAEATGAKVLTVYSCHTVSKADFDAGETYLSLMERNLTAMTEALN